jgi:anaerobic selenocysteine-containing dehydrogenase
MPLLWGATTAARKAGAKLLVVDPQRTHEARLADIFLQLRPGSDVALALGMINVILGEELYDRDFVARHTLGFDQLADRATDYPPGRVAELTWVPEEQLTAAARMLATHRPAIVHGSNGLCQSGTMAVQAGRALACIVAITGNLGVEGGHNLAGPPQDIIANGEAIACDALPDEQRAKRLGADAYPFIGDGYADVNAAMARAWYGRRHSLSWCASAHEPTLWQAILTGEPYPVKALIVQCHNALGSGANAHLAHRALTSEALELLVVHDLFLNRTSLLADYVLPAAHWLEKPFYSSAYGYQGFAGDYAETEAAAIPAEHPSDYDLWRDLGRRLGQAEQWPDTAEEFWDSLLRPAGLDFASVSRHRGPLTGEEARLASRRHVPKGGSYGTSSGKVELWSSWMEKWSRDPMPSYDPPRLFELDPDLYPLVLTTGGRDITGFHQNAQQMPSYRAHYPDPLASLHPEAAEAAGIASGDWMSITTPIGTVTQRARIVDTIPPRVVHADRWWYPELRDDQTDPFGFWATNINVCTDDGAESCDPTMGSWLLRALPCRIARAQGSVTSDIESMPRAHVGSSAGR